jgi:hypothetical protein
VAILNGGTGQTTASAAFNALSPITTTGDLILGTGVNTASRLGIGANGYLLSSNGTTASWQPAPAGGVTTFAGGTTGLTPASATSGAISLAGTLVVSNGGTGATTLTGYVKGAGTTALTASSTIPNTDITGLGTMSTQNANSVAVTGGAIDGTTVGATTAAAVTGTTITASTKFVGTNFDASGSGGGALRTSSSAPVLQWGAGGGVNLTLDGAFNMNPANATIQISPTGTGTLTVNPATAGTMNNMAIGGSTPLAGAFTTLSATSTISANGSVGSSGQVLTSAGAGSPAVWATAGGGVTIVDDTTTNATRYLVFTSATTGSVSTQNVSSTKLQYNPSTGAFTANQLIIAP